MFELAIAAAHGAGKGARFMAEQFGFDQRRRQGGAVDGDEGLARPGAEVVQRAGDQVLAGARLAHDQHIGFGRPQRADAPPQVDHRRRTPRQPGFQIVRLSGGRAQHAVFQHQAPVFRRAGHDFGQLRGGKRLFHKVIGAFAHRPHRQLHIAVPGDQDHRDIPVDRMDAVHQAEPVDARHADIRHHHAGKAETHQIQRPVALRQRLHRKPGQVQRLRSGFAQVGFIVDQQDARGRHAACSAGAAARRSSVNTAPPSGAFPAVRSPPKSLTML